MDGNSDHLQHKHEHGVAPPYPRFNSQQPNDTLSEYKKSSLHLSNCRLFLIHCYDDLFCAFDFHAHVLYIGQNPQFGNANAHPFCAKVGQNEIGNVLRQTF